MSYIDDLARQRVDGTMQAPPDDLVRDSCPLLWELLVLDTYDDKEHTKRVMPEIVVGRVNGGYAVTVKDHETCQQKQLFALRWAEIPQEVERALSDPTRPWYAFKSFKNRLGEKKVEKMLTNGNGHG